jgi:hypothetical protein
MTKEEIIKILRDELNEHRLIFYPRTANSIAEKILSKQKPIVYPDNCFGESKYMNGEDGSKPNLYYKGGVRDCIEETKRLNP